MGLPVNNWVYTEASVFTHWLVAEARCYAHRGHYLYIGLLHMGHQTAHRI